MAAMAFPSSLRFPYLLRSLIPKTTPFVLTPIIKHPLRTTAIFSSPPRTFATTTPIVYDLVTDSDEDDDDDDEADFPHLSHSGMAASGLKTRKHEGALYINVEMPGFGKEHVRVRAEKETKTLIIEGEGDKEWDDVDDDDVDGDDVNGDDVDADEDGRRVFEGRIDLAEGRIFELDKMRAVMRNGVLRLVVPTVKEEDRTDVIKVAVE